MVEAAVSQVSPRTIQLSIFILAALSLGLLCMTLMEKPCRTNGSYAPYKSTNGNGYGSVNGNDLGSPYVYRSKETLSAWPIQASQVYEKTGPPLPSPPEPLGQQTSELTGLVLRAPETYTPIWDSIATPGRRAYMKKDTTLATVRYS